MEIPSWVGKVATGVALSNPVTAPVVLGKWVADKASGALGPKTEAAPPIQPKASAPPPPPKPVAVEEKPGEIKPAYTQDPNTQTNGGQKLTGADGKWNGPEILNGQTQLSKDDPSYIAEQQNRCGPSAVLASSVMKGPDATGKLVDRLSFKAKDDDQKQELAGIKSRIADGTATHKDLSRVQHFMYQDYHVPGEKPGLSAAQMSQMEQDLSGTSKNMSLADFDNQQGSFRTTAKDGSGVEESPDKMKQRIEGLKNGQSFVQQIDSNGKGAATANHFVLMGKDESGRSYVYDPGAKTNQPQVVYQDQRPQAYSQYADGNMGITDQGQRAQVMAGSVMN